MWWFFGGLGALLYIVLLISLGISTFRKGHYVLFTLGLFFPLLWIIGALSGPTAAAASRQPV